MFKCQDASTYLSDPPPPLRGALPCSSCVGVTSGKGDTIEDEDEDEDVDDAVARPRAARAMVVAKPTMREGERRRTRIF